MFCGEKGNGYFIKMIGYFYINYMLFFGYVVIIMSMYNCEGFVISEYLFMISFCMVCVFMGY